jgi:hypothetical protein
MTAGRPQGVAAEEQEQAARWLPSGVAMPQGTNHLVAMGRQASTANSEGLLVGG